MIQGNGPYRLTQTHWIGPVTITAGDGFLPVLEAEPGDDPVWTSAGDLTLRGLTLRYPASTEKFGLFLRIDSGRFMAEYCRFAMPESPETLQRALPKRAFVDFTKASEVVVEHCEWIGREMTCFVFQPGDQHDGGSAGPVLRFRENAIHARSLVQFESPPSEPAPRARVLLEDNMARVHNVFVFGERDRGQPASFVPVEIEARRNVFEGRYAVVSWPEAFGGRGASRWEWLIFEEEY